ncbi:MAG: hypothetical protein UX91_C0007G0182 [Candidatus Amesbacteria bacterium GW2011_GWB1_47_19]|nr:MAG: hypothetical protein UW51_C0006G0008 [Candidatus Amesbacteria bacterium GW2011_GWA1_44_24]KKU31959.1 MAG: hypothetical protein UX46_C0002G0182 [Candidatus Amesbacteria bacterium GW2011_GWC1_46_24]KKU66895.1 MAG: hypothetical protein UX91_C0007G0182 [Candidatus Amesbacteria bacterium GW2011_GWB1_47_19]OGD05962.1 MAG: hypothetical protein A2379_02820 [Candidatus Amesbacteria bacterium RIFOXYB1_FULL_47_13]HBC72235.1 hypothetical protein [Candidatus Amesbacteria bacterium]
MDYTQDLLSQFRQQLISQSVSPNTLKNYVSDLRVLLFFVSTQYQPLTPESLSTITQPEVAKKYEEYLTSTNPPATVKRRLSSMRKFIDFCHQTNLLQPAPIPPIQTPDVTFSPPPPAPTPPTPSYSPPLSEPIRPLDSSTPNHFDLIKLMPEVVHTTPVKNRVSSFAPAIVYPLLLIIFIGSFFLTYFLLK